MLPLRNKGEFSDYSLRLTTASHSTDLYVALMFLGKSTALFSCQIKKVKGWLGGRCQGMLGYSPENKRYCMFGGGAGVRLFKDEGGWRHCTVIWQRIGGQLGLFQ